VIEEPLLLGIDAKGLSDDEQETVDYLQMRIFENWPLLNARLKYYEGTQPMRNLGIAVPPELEQLHTAAGWPGVVVDTIDERLEVAGFRLGDSASADSDMWDIWTHSRMEHESGLAHLDALTFGRAFVMVGSSDDGSGMPLITAESPLNMGAVYDTPTHRVRAALQAYDYYGDQAAALYLPDQTVHMVNVQGAGWQVRDRDEHRLGRCPVVMLSNRPRTSYRYGHSEITPELMSWTDAACRSLLRMEIGAEFFSAPQRYIIGASESAFTNPDGTPADAWETYIGRLLALERDEEGNVPAVGQFTAADPSPHMNHVLTLTRLVSARTGVSQDKLGFTSDNPASAQAIEAADATLNRRSKRRMRGFGAEWREVQTLALTIAGNGQVPADAHQIEVIWAAPETPTPAETSAAIAQQVTIGAIPATSDVTLTKLGYTPMEITRLAADRKAEQGQQNLQAIASRLGALQQMQPQPEALPQPQTEPAVANGGG